MKSRCKCCHHLKIIFLSMQKQNAVSAGILPLIYQKVIHSLKLSVENLSLSSWSHLCNLELRWAPATDSSSQLVAFAAQVTSSVEAAVARLMAGPCAGGCASTPPSSSCCFCSPLLPRMVSRSPRCGDWGGLMVVQLFGGVRFVHFNTVEDT